MGTVRETEAMEEQQTSSSNITWEFVRNADFRLHPSPPEAEAWKRGPAHCVLTNLQVLLMYLQMPA